MLSGNKKNRYKKCIAWCLILLTLLPFAVGCRKNPTNQPNTSQNDTAAETVPFDDEVPDNLKFDGRVFTFCCPGPDEWGVESYDRDEMSFPMQMQTRTAEHQTLSGLPRHCSMTESAKPISRLQSLGNLFSHFPVCRSA